MKARKSAINELLQIMARLRSPTGCPWDREQTHLSLRFHAVEEVYELMDAIEASDDHEMAEELGDLLLQVVFHCQLARERGAFDFEKVCRLISEKLIRRHPHVFGATKVKTVEGVWTQWEQIKKAEKHGTRHARPSVLDGIPKHLPALLRAEKLIKKARKAGLAVREAKSAGASSKTIRKQAQRLNRSAIGKQLFALVSAAQSQGLSAEALLRAEAREKERRWRRTERAKI